MSYSILGVCEHGVKVSALLIAFAFAFVFSFVVAE